MAFNLYGGSDLINDLAGLQKGYIKANQAGAGLGHAAMNQTQAAI